MSVRMLRNLTFLVVPLACAAAAPAVPQAEPYTWRNVAISGPWMHDGAFTTLEATVRHHLDPTASLQNFDVSQLTELMADTCQDQPDTLAAILKWKSPDNASEGVDLSELEMLALLAFLDSLTAPSALDLSHTIPESVPSGLPVGGNIMDTQQVMSTQP